jgi:hypothetical protein
LLFFVLLVSAFWSGKFLNGFYFTTFFFFNALAFQSLFEGDDTLLGRFFFRVGTIISLKAFDEYSGMVGSIIKSDTPDPKDVSFFREMRNRIKRGN